MRTKSDGYTYSVYIGIDDDDHFFLEKVDALCSRGLHPVIVSGCQHAPAWVWNKLFETAVKDGHDYFFQIGDDVILQTPGWTERFIHELRSRNNKGCVGPINRLNYAQRINAGKPFVIENSFVHKTHYELFHTFFHPSIRNWYCDDWITRVYNGVMCMDIEVQNGCVDNRYNIEVVDITPIVCESKRRLYKGCFSFCLYGEYTSKYYKGLEENVQIIRKEFPNWDIHVYAAPEAEAYVRSLGVTCIPTLKTGPVNMTYRFLSSIDSTYDVVCVRDTDSRIHERDRWCISHFLDSPYQIYTIRDHSYHRYRIMGGLWGAKRGSLFQAERLREYCDTIRAGYTSDTCFLDNHIDRTNMIVYSYVSGGLFNDPNEKIELIQCPLPNRDFCGNVVLYREDGSSYNQFSQV